jgi:hypothetical protein
LWGAPLYDAVGNATSLPKPGDPANAHTLIHDAWNRLLAVEESGGTDVAELDYDGLNRRTAKAVTSQFHGPFAGRFPRWPNSRRLWTSRIRQAWPLGGGVGGAELGVDRGGQLGQLLPEGRLVDRAVVFGLDLGVGLEAERMGEVVADGVAAGLALLLAQHDPGPRLAPPSTEGRIVLDRAALGVS